MSTNIRIALLLPLLLISPYILIRCIPFSYDLYRDEIFAYINEHYATLEALDMATITLEDMPPGHPAIRICHTDYERYGKVLFLCKEYEPNRIMVDFFFSPNDKPIFDGAPARFFEEIRPGFWLDTGSARKHYVERIRPNWFYRYHWN